MVTIRVRVRRLSEGGGIVIEASLDALLPWHAFKIPEFVFLVDAPKLDGGSRQQHEASPSRGRVRAVGLGVEDLLRLQGLGAAFGVVPLADGINEEEPGGGFRVRVEAEVNEKEPGGPGLGRDRGWGPGFAARVTGSGLGNPHLSSTSNSIHSWTITLSRVP